MTTYQPSATRSGEGTEAPLRLALRVDAVACLAFGGLLAAVGALLSPFLGLPTALLWPAGAFLLVFGLLLWLVAARTPLSGAAVRSVIAVNAVWVLASAALVVLGLFAPTFWGISFVLVQAAAVAALTVVEVVLLRRSDTVR